MMHRDARALDLCPCITRDVPYDARMMHRDALMRLMHLGLGDAWCIKGLWLFTTFRSCGDQLEVFIYVV